MRQLWIATFAVLALAHSSTAMVLLDDGRTLLAWTGNSNVNTVVITAPGLSNQVAVASDGIFHWTIPSPAPTGVTVIANDCADYHRLSRPSTSRPTAFLIPDRPAYRQGTILQFVGFLRQATDGRRFAPIPNRDVVVEIRTAQRRTLIKSLTLKSDTYGRIEGHYTFSESDVLDTYELSVKDFAGSTQVALADFRKPKVRVEVTHALDGNELLLTACGLDYTGQPIAANAIDISIDIVRSAAFARRDNHLDTGASAFAEKNAFDPTAGSREERALRAVTQNTVPDTDDAEQVLWSQRFQPAIGTNQEATLRLNLDPQWQKPSVRLRASVVLTDANGWEQRTTRLIDLLPPPSDLALVLSRQTIHPGEPVDATLVTTGSTANAVALVYRLSALTAPDNTGIDPWKRWNMFAVSSAAYFPSYDDGGWNSGEERTPWRTLVGCIPMTGKTAQINLTKPGAYIIQASSPALDGKTRTAEASVIVEDETRTLLLDVPTDEAQPGSSVPCVLRGRGIGRDALIVLRDGSGLLNATTVRLDPALNGEARLVLPPQCGYVVLVSAYAMGPDGRIHAAHRHLRSPPADKDLPVTVIAPHDPAPGSETEVEIRTGDHPACVAITVHDASLLGVAPDRIPDMPSFYYADARMPEDAAWMELTRRLGTLTIRDVTQHVTRATSTPLAFSGRSVEHWLELLGQSSILTTRALPEIFQAFGIRHISVSPSLSRLDLRFETLPGDANARISDILRRKLSNNLASLKLLWTDDVLMLDLAYPIDHSMDYARYASGYSRLSRYGGWRGRADAFHSDLQFSANAMASAQSLVSFAPPMPSAGAAPEAVIDTGYIRRDFSDTACFRGTLRTDRDGRATVRFRLPDSLTHWRIVARAIDDESRVGCGTGSFCVDRPIMVWPMLPVSFNEGDHIRVFAMVHNRTGTAQVMRVSLAVTNGAVASNAVQTVTVPAHDSTRVYWTFTAGDPGFTELLMEVSCRAGRDGSLKRLPVFPCRIETAITAAGFAEGSDSFSIPSDINLSKARLSLTLAPNMLADMVDTLPYLVDYPHGCVEQTMSRFLPVIKVSQVLSHVGVEAPDIRKKLPEYVDAGIKRLLALQQADGGWGWQTGGKTHEMMTPYALYGLLEAEQAGYPSGNPDAIARGLARLDQFIAAMGDAQAADRIYCMYVSALRKPLMRDNWDWIERIVRSGKASDYALALALEMAVRADRRELADKARQQLASRAHGFLGRHYWTTAGFSRWSDSRHEITAVVLKALVARDPVDPLIPGILQFFAATKEGGRWTSTKDTAMVLYALSDLYRTRNVEQAGPTALKVTLNNGKAIAVSMDGQLSQTVDLNPSDLRKGRNTIAFTGDRRDVLFRLSVHVPRRAENIAPVNDGIAVNRRVYRIDPAGNMRELTNGVTVPRGSYLYVTTAAVIDERDKIRYALVDTPKPSGCQIVPQTDERFTRWQATGYGNVFREDKSRGVLWHHEEGSRQLTDACIWFAEMSGTYRIPPARSELLYQPDVRGSSAPFTLTIGE